MIAPASGISENNQVDRGWILSLDADYELSDAFIAELGDCIRRLQRVGIVQSLSTGFPDDRCAGRSVHRALCFIVKMGLIIDTKALPSSW